MFNRVLKYYLESGVEKTKTFSGIRVIQNLINKKYSLYIKVKNEKVYIDDNNLDLIGDGRIVYVEGNIESDMIIIKAMLT